MDLKKLIRDYFDYSRKDRIGILTLATLILATLIAPGFFPTNNSSLSGEIDTAWISILKQLELKDSLMEHTKFKDGYAHPASPGDETNEASMKRELFFFDPNTIPDKNWNRLGLRDKTIKTIRNYLNKGGHFYEAKDLEKIYGLKEQEFKTLYPYIRIESKIAKDRDTIKSTYLQVKNVPRYQPVEINIADTTAFIALPGIGSKLAARIVSFREKLGGFYSIEQVRETYGLQDSVFEKIKVYLRLETTNVRQTDINRATVDDLKIHPYIRFQIATAIVSYREQHGRFSILEDLKKIIVITPDVYSKIAPYLIIGKD